MSSEVAVVWKTAPAATATLTKNAAPAPTKAPVVVDWDKELADWPPLKWPEEPIRPAPPTSKAINHIRLLAGAGVIALVIFFWWLLAPERRGDSWLFWPLFAALLYRSLAWIVEWLNYARPKFEPYVAPRRQWTVDVLTTACPGEPRGMILRTLIAMKAITYPHRDVLCDEGDDPVLKEACRQLGVTHVTRKIKSHAKAGNINNGLTQCDGEIAIVIDPDHEPAPYIIDRVLGYFEDPTVGFVQSVQAYRNQKDSLVADGAAKQTYLFYGPLMIGMNSYGTTQAIGANCAFRRAALDSIGGHSSGLAEDMHTTLQIYAQSWRSVYIPEVLTRGLVPSTLLAYCKQQLKWACGSVDLWLRIYPKLFSRLTGWQRLHYFLGPLYFFRGVFSLMNITIPIVCLAFGGVGLRINLVEYLAMFAPAMIIAAVIRQLTQHWTIEEEERGAHLIGGLLATGCWWVFLQGVVCAIFNVKLPYLPTPKDNEARDCWGLVTPNLLAAGLSLAAVVYGLHVDWTPYSFFMASFAVWNLAQLLFVAFLGQQRTRQKFAWFFVRRDWLGRAAGVLEHARFVAHDFVLRLMRERALAVAIPVIVLALTAQFWPRGRVAHSADRFKETGGFYVGLQSAAEESEDPLSAFDRASKTMGVQPRLFPISQPWMDSDEGNFPASLAREARRRKAVPLITWELKTQSSSGERTSNRDSIYTAIARGEFDDYLQRYAETVRDFRDPVMIRFAPRPDSDENFASGERIVPEDYVGAWIYVVSYFNKLGASNVGWVWSPARAGTMDRWFPGHGYVDWIGLSALNHGNYGGGKWREFSQIYAPFRARAEELKLPVLVTEFGSTDHGGNRASWLANAFAAMARDLPEIRGVILSTKNTGWFANDAAASRAIVKGLALGPLSTAPKKTMADWKAPQPAEYRSPFVQGEPGEFQLLVEQKPFYVRGIAYNPGHDWRDGNIPLTRRELESDFTRINALGANTIRRYGRGWYDRNLVRMAEQKNLKVLYGFWFEHHIDYLNDSAKLATYQSQVERTVRSWRDQRSILAWSLGNEVWGLLKHHYSQPYLTEVRHAHVDFVERLARRVHELDPNHPVFAAHEHSPHIAGTLVDYARSAPSLDFTAVNSYYETRISELQRVAAQFDSRRPYLLSEFGPDGYWDERFARRDSRGGLLEPDSETKAATYERGWSSHTIAHRGSNIGGVAYCWRDRLEATATWFGINDSAGLPKPTFHALQRLWKGSAETEGPRLTSFAVKSGHLEPGATIEVQAEAQGSSNAPLHYQWKLATEDFEFDVGKIRPSKDGRSAKVTLPKKPGAYRLYVNVNDGSAADEGNLPIALRPAPPAFTWDMPRAVPTIATQP
jgi:hypothetical protein